VLSTIAAFLLGFCVKSRLVERQLDELVIVARRPSTFAGANC
jgi:hypothetical protein